MQNEYLVLVIVLSGSAMGLITWLVYRAKTSREAPTREPIAPPAHELAATGAVPWGRQPGDPALNVRARGRATLKARVYRAATNTWEEVN